MLGFVFAGGKRDGEIIRAIGPFDHSFVRTPFGEIDGTITPRLKRLVALLNQVDDIAGFELWAKHLAHIDREDFGIGGARDQEGRIDPLPAQRGDKGGGLPVAVRHGSDAALPPETASVQTRQLGVERVSTPVRI